MNILTSTSGASSIDKPVLIILGAGIEQVPCYEKAKAMGCAIIGVDRDACAPGLQLSDYKVIASVRDIELLLGKLKTLHLSGLNFAGVTTAANDVPYSVARVAEFFNLPGHSPEVVEKFSDKLEFKRIMQHGGILSPKYWYFKNYKEFEGWFLTTGVDSRFVLKPRDGRGSLGVVLVDHNSDLELAWQKSSNASKIPGILCEEFIGGVQYSTESVIIEGRLTTCGIAERNYSRLDEFRPHIIEDGGTIWDQYPHSLECAIDKVLKDAALALNFNDGILKGDLVMSDDGRPMIIELAPRLSGGWFSSHQIPEARGIDLITIQILMALGRPVPKEMLVATKNKSTCIRYWFPPSGTVKGIEGEDKLLAVPGLLQYDLFRKPGENQPVIQKHSDRFGYVIVSSDSRERSEMMAQLALNVVEIEIDDM